MLPEDRQNQLAEVVPLGMADLPEHLKYRQEIEDQQQQLAELMRSFDRHKPNKNLGREDLEVEIEGRIGICEIQSQYFYQNHTIPKDHQTVIIIATPMNYDAMITAPSLESASEILRSYMEAGKQLLKLVTFMQQNGYEVMAHHPMGDINEYHQLLLPPHAVAAGMGERGRTGLFIDYEYGPLVRLAAISTSAKLEHTPKQIRGITEFCHRCKYCVSYCPPNALPDGSYLEQVISGEPMDFKINAHRCFQYFQEHNGCGRCIVHCILAEQDPSDISRRMDRIEKWYHKWVVSGKLDEMYERELQSS